MNQLEKAILDGAKAAQSEYEDMTGWWLSHGPESFLMCTIANKVTKKGGFWVFVDASPKKIREEREDGPPRGRPPKNLAQRFDIVVWAKASNDVRAIIEIKRAWSIANLRGDRRKIAEFMEKNEHVKTGYLLAYTEAKGRQRDTTLSHRLKTWAESLKCTLVGSTSNVKGDGEWGWAIGLFRI